ncbi:hypothetical protein [Williamwhitmania taraxaci]|uniref:T9SS C-terminal target domain-containing protein n=1 Tax=Williamwhitmania taraxaci TaxID=1640674 RepID=A0A1G6NDQ4_9BACT|nr:hypothetical protein [Williamwhitmania taraxaci]SDC65970.1 hypothetical protein SAMN05216323_104224 [Williamwhitmania taraxaci]
MKTRTNLFLGVMMLVAIFTSCSKEDDTTPVGPVIPTDAVAWTGTSIGDGSDAFEIKGKYTIKKGVYSLKGWVYIVSGSELYIEPGTIIKGDKATKATIIVEPGGKLFAEGTQALPIIMTSAQAPGSRKPGDWGGLVICGKAKNNAGIMTIEGGLRTQHGGSDDTDNSGVIRYVRIEFAGYPFATDQEINGLTMGSVGNGTKVDHVQVSYSNDDSYEWFGGSVSCKYLIAFRGWDDDFDTDNGFSGKMQFLLGVRDPKIADQSVSNGFESDNNASGTATEPYTSAAFSNVTLIGPKGKDAQFANTASYVDGGGMNPNNGSRLGLFHSAIQIRRNSHLNIFNSVAVGYPVGLIVENDKGSATQTAATNGVLAVQNVVFGGMTILGSDKNKTWLDQFSSNATTLDATKVSFSNTYFLRDNGGNSNLPSIADLKLSEINYGPMAGSPLVGKSNLFTPALLNNATFDKVDFIGAFRSDSDTDNWTKGWTNFDPQNTVY